MPIQGIQGMSPQELTFEVNPVVSLFPTSIVSPQSSSPVSAVRIFNSSVPEKAAYKKGFPGRYSPLWSDGGEFPGVQFSPSRRYGKISMEALTVLPK
jgi:hypothetical protein